MSQATLIETKRGGYHRSVATEDVDRFIGWEYLMKLIEQVPGVLEDLNEKWKNYQSSGWKLGRPPTHVIKTPTSIKMHQAAIATLFETGGRACEVFGLYKKLKGVDKYEELSPPLTPRNFEFDGDFIRVWEMPVLKRVEKGVKSVIREKHVKVQSTHAHLWKLNEKLGMYERNVIDTTRRRVTRDFAIERARVNYDNEKPGKDYCNQIVEAA